MWSVFAIMLIVLSSFAIEQIQQMFVTQEAAEVVNSVKEGGFLSRYWSYIALFISEGLAFVPSKFSGIAQSIFEIGKRLFSKSE